MVHFVLSVISLVALIFSLLHGINPRQFVLLYFSLGLIVSFFILKDIAKNCVDNSRIEDIGVANFNGKFAIINWPKFLIFWIFGSVFAIPASLVMMLFIVLGNL